ncbi:methyltransferase family protein [Gillisia mitskevichiae]|uniref:Methyltransferase family protein n=1 Tax=Gillisia mitskevichiae TaxID=270921 RepID=A0A495P3N6_9FLAO|nr:class I SAM-dependent methyltransferase [Gillisia mitskevichiae]RKS45123.1 methyltransferase family protein [Gillisia mitskevichiae]
MKVKKRFKNIFKSLLNKLPHVKTLYKTSLNSRFPAGHYYSTVVSIDDIKKRELEIWKNVNKDGVPGIDLKTEEQIKLLNSFSGYYAELPFTRKKQPNLRYRFDNAYYSYSDGIILYSMIRHFKPKRIIEIGSGFSSANMLDTNELFFDNKIDITFIEPHPEERLIPMMTKTDRNQTTVIKSDVQLIPLEVFKKLQAGDILFVDSTHAVKTGSDVNYILFEILPALKYGVLIHFHDIFYPFEYPKDWVFKGYGWNEAYFLKAFLMNNDKFDIRFFTDYLHKHHQESFNEIPLAVKGSGSSLWIEKK